VRRAIRRCLDPWAHSRNQTTWQSETPAGSIFVLILTGGIQRARDHVFFRRPISQIDDAAPFATEGHFRIVNLHFFFADGTPHA
jgi:hypothetical protein